MAPRWVGPLVVALLVGACGGEVERGLAARSGFVDERCADVVVVAVRGQSQSRAANLGAGTENFRIAAALAERLRARDTSVRLESVDYDNSSPPDVATYDENVAVGVDRLRGQLATLDRDCPGTGQVVVGFSEGANVVHEALARGTAAPVRAVALVADPRRDPSGDVTQETFGSSAPYPGVLGAGPALGPLADRALSFCNAADDVCNLTPGKVLRGTQPVHQTFYERPATVDDIASRIDRVLRR